MTKSRGRPIVIDASVARSAGQSEHPISSACRQFLEQVLRICHRMVSTEAIRDEWKRHASRYARMWQATMYARRKVDALLSEPRDDSLRDAMGRLAASPKAAQSMLKDAHLLEAARAASAPVASCDDEARSYFWELARSRREVAEVVWVNPANSEERCIDWLRDGAPSESGRRLGCGA